jgi:hypothetical protein
MTSMPTAPRGQGGCADVARRSAGVNSTIAQIVKVLARQAAREWLKSGPEPGAVNPKEEN